MKISEYNRSCAVVHLHDQGCFAKQVLDSLSAYVAVIDSDGTIVSVNHAWRNSITVQNSLTDIYEGSNYLDFLESEHGAHIDGAGEIAQGIRDVLAQQCLVYSREYSAISLKAQRWFAVKVAKFRSNNMLLAVVAHEDITERKLIELERDETIDNLQRALSEARELRGMLPMCAGCKKIRDDEGYWQEVEHYISTHSSAKLTHGLCPACASRLYPDVADEPVSNEVAESIQIKWARTQSR